MADISRGKIDIVAVTRLDRWARSTRGLIKSLEALRNRGIDFVSVDDGLDTTSRGSSVFRVIAALDRLAADLRREKTILGLIDARRRGVRVGRPRVHVDVVRAQTLLRAGSSYRTVARMIGCGASTLHRAVREVERRGVSASGVTAREDATTVETA